MIGPHEIRTVAINRGIITAGKITGGTFDLDHPCAHIHQAGGTERRGKRLFDGNDQQIGKRVGHHLLQSRKSGCAKRFCDIAKITHGLQTKNIVGDPPHSLAPQ